jgi:glycosyltransferase involved in cell wall biosynthesis
MKNHLLSLLEHSDRGSFEPAVAGPPEITAAAAGFGAEVFPLDIKGELDPLRDARAVFELIRVLQKKRVDVLHAHGSKAGVVGRLAALLAGTPAVFLTAHNSVFYEEWPAYKKRVVGLAQAILARGTSRVIAVSEALRAEIIAREKVDPAKVVTVHNGIEPARFKNVGPRELLRQRLNLPADSAVIGTIARLAPQKGVRYLIQAAALIPAGLRPVFLVVGEGPLRAELEASARNAGVADRFIFTGLRSDIPLILGALDLLVLPSVTEGLPLVLLEAMAASLPVVATRVGGVPEAVVDGKTGIVVPPQDAPALAAAIAALLAAPDRARQFGAAGEDRVSRVFTVHRMVSLTTELYLETLAGNGLVRPAMSR